MLRIAIVGSSNTGKTTVLNTICNASARVGNFYGTTVEVEEIFTTFRTQGITFFDLPGFKPSNQGIRPKGSRRDGFSIKGLAPEHADNMPGISEEERVALRFLYNLDGYDGIIQVIDAKNLLHELKLVRELMYLGKPIVVAVNFVDEADWDRIPITYGDLEKAFGLPFIPIDPHNRINIDKLLTHVVLRSKDSLLPKDLGRKPSVSSNSPEQVEDCFNGLLAKLQNDSHNSVNLAIEKPWQAKVDSVLTNKYFGLPIFFGLSSLMFATIFYVGNPICDFLSLGLGKIFSFIAHLLPIAEPSVSQSSILKRYIFLALENGIKPGVSTIIEFIPKILILNFWIMMLEMTGYMTRASVLLSRFLGKFGLPGSSLFPIVSGFGCSIMGYMSTRSIANERERLASMIAVNFVPCHAQLVVTLFISQAVFGSRAPLVMSCMYIGSILFGLFAAKVYSMLRPRLEVVNEYRQLPPYRMPDFSIVYRHSVRTTLVYFKYVGKLMIPLSLVLWLFSHIQYSPRDENYMNAITELYNSYVYPAKKQDSICVPNQEVRSFQRDVPYLPQNRGVASHLSINPILMLIELGINPNVGSHQGVFTDGGVSFPRDSTSQLRLPHTSWHGFWPVDPNTLKPIALSSTPTPRYFNRAAYAAGAYPDIPFTPSVSPAVPVSGTLHSLNLVLSGLSAGLVNDSVFNSKFPSDLICLSPNFYLLENSIIGRLSKIGEPLFELIGFDWRMALSTLSAIGAREVALTTIGVLYSDGPHGKITVKDSLALQMPPPSALSYMVFMLLLTPCLAATWVFLRESRVSKRKALYLLSSLNLAGLFVVIAVYYSARFLFG